MRILSHSLLPIVAGILFVPAILIATNLISGDGFADVLLSSSIYIIYYPPLLCVIAAIRPHFKTRYAVYPILLIPIIDLVFPFPGYGVTSLLGFVFQPVFPDTAPDVLGKSMLLLLGALAALLSLLHRVTIFRIVVGVLGAAQCVTVVLFHIVAISGPFDGMVAQEASLTRGLAQRDGTIEAICNITGRSCFRGTPQDALLWVGQELTDASQASRFIVDTQDVPRVMFTWLENPTPQALRTVSLVTAHKVTANDITIMVSNDGPSALYYELRASIGILLAAFHQAWITLTLLILWRHGDYVYAKNGWTRSKKP
jgi:hypothetical protein